MYTINLLIDSVTLGGAYDGGIASPVGLQARLCLFVAALAL